MWRLLVYPPPPSPQDAAQWHALPYEIASAYVRTLALTVNALQNSKKNLAVLREKDAHDSKPATIKARNEYTGLRNCKRWIVMNKRTGCMATQEFLAKNVRTSDGRPVFKKMSAKQQPWVVTLGFKVENTDAQLTLQLTTSSPFYNLRCFDLSKGQQRSKLTILLEGYEHMGHPLEDIDGDNDFSDNASESSETMIGSDQGLEGRTLKRECFMPRGGKGY